MFAKFYEIPSKILQDSKETERYGHTFGRSDGRTDGQRENSIPSHKHSLRGGGIKIYVLCKLVYHSMLVKVHILKKTAPSLKHQTFW